MTTVNPKFAQNGDEKGKVFIGGLSWETTTASMLKYFSRYGEVIDCVVMKNQQTGKSRGFGFVKFRDPSCVETVLSSGPHILDGRQIDPKACNPRSMNKGSAKNNELKNKNKIFLGGLPSNCTESQIKEVFSQFGKVECKRAEPRELKELTGLQLAGGVFANGALGMPGMALGPGIISSPYQSLAAQHQLAAAQGITLVPAGPHIIPLTLPGAGGLNMAGGGVPGLVAASSMGDADATTPGWTHQMATMSGPAYLPSHPGSQFGASQATLGMQSYSPASQQESQGGYISVSPVPGSTSPGPQGSEESAAAQKPPYVFYSNQASQLGILGNYPQEASSYGPSRSYVQDGAVPSGIQTPYTASVTYAAAPGIALPQATSYTPPYVGALGNGYGSAVPLSFAYGGQGDATAAAAAYTAAAMQAVRSSTLTQGYHPYRR